MRACRPAPLSLVAFAAAVLSFVETTITLAASVRKSHHPSYINSPLSQLKKVCRRRRGKKKKNRGEEVPTSHKFMMNTGWKVIVGLLPFFTRKISLTMLFSSLLGIADKATVRLSGRCSARVSTMCLDGGSLQPVKKRSPRCR